MPGADLRATRANRIFCTDEKHIRAENTVMVKYNNGFGVVFCTRSPIACGRFFVRAKSPAGNLRRH